MTESTVDSTQPINTTFGHSDEMFKDLNFIKLLGNGIRPAATGN